MNDYDCFVITSMPTGQPEGVPIAMIRTSLLSIPIITSMSGSIKSLARNGENFLIVDNYSPKQFADKLMLISENPRRAKEMAHNAYMEISKIYSCQAILAGFESLIS